MARVNQPWILFPVIGFLFFSYTLPLSSSQNIETFFPSGSPPVNPTTFNSSSSNDLPISPPLTPVSPAPPPPLPPPPISRTTSHRTVAKAVAATAASTLVLAGIFFFFLQRYDLERRRRRSEKFDTFPRHRIEPVVSPDEFKRFDGTLKGLVVDENGLDVLYWRKLESGNAKNSFCKEVLRNDQEEEEEEKEEQVVRKGNRRRKSEPIQESPLPRGKTSNSSDRISLEAIPKPPSSIRPPKPLISAPPLPPPPPQPPQPPPPPKKNPAPPPPPPPPIPAKISPAPPQTGGLTSSWRPPTVPKGKSNGSRKAEFSSPGETMTGTSSGPAKLKPLHWDKVTANADHSMVWDKINDGSFRFDDDLMEALFGYVATNRKSPERRQGQSSLNPVNSNSGPSPQIFILEPRKSQNTAIVLRSLALSRKEILDALLEGQGLNAETLEKLARIAPTQEEEARILDFSGNSTKLADAESFLFHILRAVPSAFTRLDAMLFRSNYDPEILHFKESLQILELGCKELRTRGLFLKLLEAILKAGNRMNAGTARGNAQAFNLTALRKLSDVKGTDGKTTLLHFVVEEVVRSEGKRCVINRDHSLGRSSSRSSNTSLNSDNSIAKEEREKEYKMLGLPIVGGLSIEFSNVKKAASVDYDAFVNTCSSLATRVAGIRQLMARCGTDEGSGGFVREIKGFLEAAEEELKVLREEQTRVMELVKRTTEYYQAGASKDKGAHPLQLFVIVKDFLSMVDQACIDIARNLQRKRASTASVGSSPPLSPARRIPVKFPNLPAHFMSDKSRSSSSSDSEDGF